MKAALQWTVSVWVASDLNTLTNFLMVPDRETSTAAVAKSSDEEKPKVGAGRMVPLETNSGYLATERILLPEDAVGL